MADIMLQGFHGTSEDNGKSIVATQRFRPSLGDAEWLGKGVYFFVDGISDPKEDATKWAELWIESRRKAVLSAEIKTSEERVFDLSKKEAMKLFNRVKEQERARLVLPSNRKRDWKGLVDTHVIGLICTTKSSGVDVVTKPCFVNFDNEAPSGVPNTTIACVVNGNVIGNIRFESFF